MKLKLKTLAVSSQITQFDRMYAIYKFNISKRLKFYRKLSMFINEGIPAKDALVLLNARFSSDNDTFALITKSLLLRLSRGDKLAAAFVGWIPNEERAMIGAGEAVNNLSLSLNRLVITMEVNQNLKSQISKEIYPSLILMLAVFLMVFAFSTYLVPDFKELMPESQRPPFSTSYFAFSDFVSQYFIFIIGFLVLFSVAIKMSFPLWVGNFRHIADKFPPYSINRKLASASFLNVLSGLVASGKTTYDSLSIMAGFSSPYVMYHINKIKNNMSQGIEVGKLFDTGLFSKELAGDMADFSQGSTFDSALETLGEESIKNTTEVIVGVSKIIRVLVMLSIILFIGATLTAVGLMVLATMEAAQN